MVYRQAINEIHSEVLNKRTMVNLIEYEAVLKELIIIYNKHSETKISI